MKLALGTAQFSGKYSLSKKKFNKKKFDNYLRYCLKNKINFIDTAQSYKGVHALISSNKYRNKFKIISKLNLQKKSTQNNFESQISNILNELKVKKLYGLLIHNPEQIIKKDNYKKIWANIDQIKKKNNVKKIGVSVYSPDDLLNIITNYKIDIVQFPLNIFDQRFLDYKKIKIFRKKKNRNFY